MVLAELAKKVGKTKKELQDKQIAMPPIVFSVTVEDLSEPEALENLLSAAGQLPLLMVEVTEADLRSNWPKLAQMLPQLKTRKTLPALVFVLSLANGSFRNQNVPSHDR